MAAAPGSARASALDATVETRENPPDPEKVRRRLESDVAMCRRVVDDLGDAPGRVDAKYAKFEALLAGKAVERAEAERMVAAAADALAAAEAALAEFEGGN